MLSEEKNLAGSKSSGPLRPTVSVRSSPKPYIASLLVLVFFSCLFFYLESNTAGLVFLFVALILVPILAFADHIAFNGKRIYRNGMLQRAWAYASGRRYWLRPRDIEQVETLVNMTMKRGGRVYFRYETRIRGKGQIFILVSGGEDYRKLAKELFSLLPCEVLDANSIEVRDYLGARRDYKRLAEHSEIPSADVLLSLFKSKGSDWFKIGSIAASKEAADLDLRAGDLQRLGNQLKHAGSLLQALESFRRALRIRPKDPWLLFDLARCLRFFALSERDNRLERKAAALLRLAERHAGGDAHLLSRLGEAYFQTGDLQRAGGVFKRSLEIAGDHFRSIRGMAELALRDGKLAHVVHNFSLASRSAQTPSLRKWSRAEAEYFARLNDDEEYLEMELGRVNLLDSIERWRRSLLRLTLLGFPVILFGITFDEGVITNSGWIVSVSAVSLWTILSISRRLFSDRIEAHLLDDG